MVSRLNRPRPEDWMTIGQVSDRSGLTQPTIRFYEEKGLIAPTRDRGGRRRFRRADIRRLSFISVAQKMGFSLARIREELEHLPSGRTPNARDWTRISEKFGAELDRRIEVLTQLREKLDGCIGCGCLSMDTCSLFNPEDRARRLGAGPRYLMGNRVEDLD